MTNAPMPLVLIPLLPLLSFAILILFGRRIGNAAGWLSVAALAGAAVVTWSLGPQVLSGHPVSAQWSWLLGGPNWTLGFVADRLSWLMLFMVTSIGTMIQCYSIGYMHGDPRFSCFFAYLSLFCASMLGLVLADHLVLFFICWEVMGLCS